MQDYNAKSGQMKEKRMADLPQIGRPPGAT